MKKKTVKKKSLVKKLDLFCGFLVRNRAYCELQEVYPSIKCNGVLQWGHIVSRRYMQIRWSLENAFCICAAHHLYFTYHPIEWDIAVTQLIGEDNYFTLKQKALVYHKLFHKDILEALEMRAAKGKFTNELKCQVVGQFQTTYMQTQVDNESSGNALAG